MSWRWIFFLFFPLDDKYEFNLVSFYLILFSSDFHSDRNQNFVILRFDVFNFYFDT